MSINFIGGAVLNFLYNEIITHVPIHFLRKGFIRIFNKQVHRSAVILMHTRMMNFWKISIGKNCVINQYCVMDCRRYKIVIGDNCDIGPYTRIWTLGHKPDSLSHGLYGGDVIIHHHVWIASGVTILPGIIINEGAVIAAASVVNRSVDPLLIVAGNPAKTIRKRDNPLNYQLNYKPFLD